MAKTAKSKSKRKKKSLGEPEDNGTPKVKRMKLGSKSDRARKKSFGIQELRPDYKSGKNVFAIVAADYETVQEHWIEVDGKNERLVCPVMAIEDSSRDEKIANTYGYADGCDFCATKKELYENHPKDSSDAVDKRARDIAKHVSSKQFVYLIVVKGVLDAFRASRKSKKTITEPKFEEEGLIAKKLKLSSNAFEVLEDAIEDADFEPEDLVGMPFNLVGGKKQGKSFVISRVEFYPDHKIKNIPKPVSLDNVAVFDPKRYEKLFKLFKKAMPDLLSGKKKLTGYASKKKKTASRRR